VTPGGEYHVATFYRFVAIRDTEHLRTRMQRDGAELGLAGTVLIAREGINGTIAGPPGAVDSWLDAWRADPRFAGLRVGFSTAPEIPFHRWKVKTRDEVVALGRHEVDPEVVAGERVDVATWNRLLDDPEVVVVDVRNRYETAVGTFPGALDPDTRAFNEFPAFVARRLDPGRDRKVAMFCTGGVRCEKASSYLLSVGFPEVLQLQGGILGYFANAPVHNRFAGDCFLFDQRVAVARDLGVGEWESCRACRSPLARHDRLSPLFRQGESCPRCHDMLTEAQRSRFAERRRQVSLAAARGERHVGARMRTENP